MTRREALREFRDTLLPMVDRQYPPDNRGRVDKPARREAWSNYIDGLHRDGMVTRRQADTWSNPF